MKGIHILATGRALPKRVVTNDDMSKIVDTSDEWIRERTGIASRYKCEEETCTTLAIEAAGKALKRSGIDKKSVYAVIVATTTAETAFPSTACMVQKALELPDDVMAFDMSAACTGFVYGLNVCRGLLMCNPGKRIILVGSEQISRIVDYTDRQSCILFGDGAGAAVIESSNSDFYHRAWSDGDADMEALWCKGIGYDGAHLMMNGKKVFRFAVGAMQQGIDGVLEDARLKIDDIDYVVCHQANLRIIRNVMRNYDVPQEKFYVNIEKYANTSAASIAIALDEMYEKGMLRPGMKIICVGFGAGLTWSSALFTV